MSQTETLEEFYKSISVKGPHASPHSEHVQEWGHFNVYRRDEIDATCINYKPYNRRDFYKISLLIGTGTLYYADKWIDIDRNALLFSNPNVPYAWETRSKEQSGYFCLFTEDFVDTNTQSESLGESPVFAIGGDPIFFIDEAQTKKIGQIFENMIMEMDSDYRYKYDLIRNYMNLIIHEALKMKPADSYLRHTDAATRITTMFMELLQRQFPVSQENILQLKSANDYAFRLSVHTNHLNRAVKKVTGRTTTEHIASRIIQEAKALLKHTDWNIADVAYCLGFENPSYFNNFFKRITNMTPRAFKT